jgi:trimethylamine:corrinoid methyltransferase-like protein
MKVVCNEYESKELCQIMYDFDQHRSVYIKVNHIEFTKQKVSRRSHIGAPMLQVETNCIKVNGSDKCYDTITTGTRYVYEGDKLYTEIRRWYDNRLQKRRDEKLENIGI